MTKKFTSDTNIILNLRHLRALVDALSKGIADFDRLSLGRESFEEFVVDARLHENTRSGAACLTMVPATDV